jgi:proline iminopeptidase
MDPLQEALASPTLRVVTYDQRGVGRSTAGGSAPFTPSDHLDDLDAIRRHFRQERVHLLGHSFGGMVALSYVDKYPDRVRSLILIGTGVSEPGVMQRSGARLGARIAQLQRQGLIPDPIPRGSCSETFTAVLPAYLADPKMAAPEPMLRRQCDRSGRSAILDAFIHTPYAGGVSTTTAPALVLYGEMDPFGPEPSAFAASVLSHAKVEVVELPRCGHLGWLECEGPFVARVRTFLQGQR